MILKLNVNRRIWCDEDKEPDWLYIETSKLKIEKYEIGPVPIQEDSREFIEVDYEVCQVPSPYYVLYTDKHVIALNGGISGYILNDKGQTVEKL